jgi:hypothetical protein
MYVFTNKKKSIEAVFLLDRRYNTGKMENDTTKVATDEVIAEIENAFCTNLKLIDENKINIAKKLKRSLKEM